MECKMRETSVHYEVYGEGRPILILHGWPGDHTFMMGSFEQIFNNIDGWKRIYIDLPGMGKTPGSKSINTHEDMLNILNEFIDTVMKIEHFYIIGFSYGAYLARGVIHRMQDSIDGAMMFGPMIYAGQGKRILPERTILNQNPKFVEEIKAINFEQALNLYVDQNEDYMDFIINVGLPAISRADFEFLDNIDFDKELSFIREDKAVIFDKPTLIITARQDHLVGYENAWDMSKLYPRATFAVLDYSGHIMSIERSMLFQSLVEDWLDRCERYF